jgi:type II secretory pathway component PulK
MVLLVVTLLMILVLEFTYTVQVESHISRNSLNAMQATALARSGINILAGALVRDTNNPPVDPDVEDEWRYFALGPCQNLLENEEALPPSWELCGRIVDEGGKINVNFTRPLGRTQAQSAPQQCGASPTTQHLCWMDALARLGGVDESLFQELEDYWVSPSLQQPRSGSQQQQQPTVLAPEFGSLEEVAAVFPPLRNRSVFDGLRNYVTAMRGVTNTRQRNVNCNTAPRRVLEAVIEDSGVVDSIITQRQEAPFKTCAEALAGAQVNPGAPSMLGTRSNVFRLEASAIVNGVGKTVRALVMREGPFGARTGGSARPSAGGTGQEVTWRLTYLDWQKESGVKAALEAAEGSDGEGLEGGDNSANTDS